MTGPEIINDDALNRLREWGGEKLLLQMVSLFLEHSPGKMDQVRSGVAGKDLRAVELASHSLKSSASNVGADRLNELAAQMEESAAEAELPVVQSLLPALEAAYDGAYAALESLKGELNE